MNPKRIFILTAIIAAVLAFASGCHRHPWSDDSLSERVIDHLDDHADDLDLSAEQTTQYDDVKVRLTADLNNTQQDHKTFKLKLKEMLDSEDADIKEMTAEIRLKLNEIPGSLSVYFDYADELWAILDDTQKESVMTEMRDKSDRKRWHHRDRHGKRSTDKLMKRIDRHVEDLELDGEQKSKYADLRARFVKTIEERKSTHNNMRAEMKALLQNENTDMKTLADEFKNKLNKMPDSASIYLDYIDEMWDILNETQKATVIDEIRDRTKYFFD